MQEAPQGTTAKLTRTATAAVGGDVSPRVRHPVAWSLTALLGGLWLFATLGADHLEPPLRKAVTEYEVWRGLDLSRGPLDVNFNDTSPKTSSTKSASKKQPPSKSKTP